MSGNITYSIASTMAGETARTEVIAENLSATNLPGYKRQFMDTESFSAILGRASGQETAAGLQGAVNTRTQIDFSQGPINETGRTLDFAIMGEGFFEVKDASGNSFYTRNGSFVTNQDAKLVNSDGYEVVASTGKLQFNKDDNLQRVQVCQDGSLRIYDEQNNNYVKELGKLKIVKFNNPAQLERVSGTYFRLGSAQAQTASDKDYKVVNGGLEMSNFSPITEMTRMIESLRKYEMSSKMLTSRDGLSRTANEKITG